MDKYDLIIILFVGILVASSVGIWNLTQPNEEKTRLEAQKIIDFRNEEHSCKELGNLYLKFYPKRYDSSISLQWKWEVRDKLIDNKCIDRETLTNLEFIETCKDGRSTGCAISKLENPELYANFNFKTQLLEAIKD